MAWRFCISALVGRDMALMENRGALESDLERVSTEERATPPGPTGPNAPEHRYDLELLPFESPDYGRLLLIWPKGVPRPLLRWVEACVESLGGPKGN